MKHPVSKSLLVVVVFVSLCGFTIFGGTQYCALTGCTFSGPIVTAGISDSRACATNYTRVGPVLCHYTGAAPTISTINTTCTTLDLNATYGVPATAKTVTLITRGVLQSGTVAGVEDTKVRYYSDNGCTVKLQANVNTPAEGWGAYSTLVTAGITIWAGQAIDLYYINGTTTIYALHSDTLTTGASVLASLNGVLRYSE